MQQSQERNLSKFTNIYDKKNEDIFLIVTLQTVEMEGYSNNMNSPLKRKIVELPVLFSLSLEPLSVQGSCRVGWSGGVPPLSYS